MAITSSSVCVLIIQTSYNQPSLYAFSMSNTKTPIINIQSHSENSRHTKRRTFVREFFIRKHMFAFIALAVVMMPTVFLMIDWQAGFVLGVLIGRGFRNHDREGFGRNKKHVEWFSNDKQKWIKQHFEQSV